ncbi:MAG: hypothetical protein AB8B77_02400, partial [Alphaproteobacteria bacterium]
MDKINIKQLKSFSRHEFVNPIGISSKTLSNLRWLEACAQLILIIMIGMVMDFPIALQESLALIGFHMLVNIYFSVSTYRLGRLSEGRALPMMAIDIIQISALAGFNGGIGNPFIFMILLPMVISAAILSRISTLILGGLALILVGLLAIYSGTVPWSDFIFGYATGAQMLELPWAYKLAIWASLSGLIIFMIGFIWATSEDSRRLSSALAEATIALSKERELSALGALAAAAAHELGSPLATISVITKELRNQNIKDSRNWNIIQEDHQMLYEQSLRCKEILIALAEKPHKHGGDPYELPTLTNLLEEIALNHLPQQIEFELKIELETRGMEPAIQRKPELLNGIGNLISNAGQFANKKVTMMLFWDWNHIRVTLQDDGPGFPHHILQAAGEPYKST